MFTYVFLKFFLRRPRNNLVCVLFIYHSFNKIPKYHLKVEKFAFRNCALQKTKHARKPPSIFLLDNNFMSFPCAYRDFI